MKKKILTHKARNMLLILALMLVGTLVPATSFAAGGWTLENPDWDYIEVLKGDDFTMEADVSPAGANVRYQWFKYEEQGGSWGYYPISGDAAKEAKYTVPSYDGKEAIYRCEVTDNDDSNIQEELYVEVHKEKDWTLVNNGSHYIDVLKGDDFTMEADVSPATANVSYQWFKYEEQGGSWGYYPISGDAAKKAKYTVPSYDGKNAEYSCVVTDNDDSSIQETLYVEVHKKKDWTLENTGRHDFDVLKGDDFTMEADVSPATANVSYQWYKDGSKLTGQTSAKYTVKNYGGNYEYYECVVTDKDNSYIQYSVEINLYKKNPWMLKDDWKEIYELVGKDFTMEVEVNPATANVSYQWFKYEEQGGSWDYYPISGDAAKKAKYTVPSYDGKNAEYRCVVTDKDDTSFSRTMDVVVSKGTSWKLENKNSEDMQVPYGSDFTLEALVSPADADVTYQWYKNGKLILGEDARKAKYTVKNYGGNNEYYECVVTDKDDNTLIRSFVINVYHSDCPWEVNGSGGGRLPFNGDPSKMQVEIEYKKGSAADFSFTYKWQKGNIYGVYKDIPGATGNSYSTNEIGDYRCVVTDGKYSGYGDFWVYEKASYPWTLGTKWSYYMVDIGDTVNLKGYIEMEEGNKESDWGLKYSWTKKEADKPSTEIIAGANGPALYVKVACDANYTLTVTDKYGNTKNRSFYISIDKRFAARDRFAVMIDDLPDVDKLTLADKAAVNAASAAYDALSVEQKQMVGADAIVKLQEAQKQIARLQKAADDAAARKAKEAKEAQIKAAKLKKVSGFSVKAQKAKKAKIKWKKTAGVSGYEVYRATKKNGKYKKVKVIKKVTVTTFTDKKLKTKKNYFYKIRPYTMVGGQKIYGKYSAVKKIKAK